MTALKKPIEHQTMNAAELHQTLKIQTPFKDWAAAQIKAGKPFKPFFGTLADGKLGNYTQPMAKKASEPDHQGSTNHD